MLRRFVFAGGLLGILALFLLCVPTTPRSATRAELMMLESRFPAVRDNLEQRVLRYQFANHVREIRDSLFAAGESLQVRQLEREYHERAKELGPLFPVGEGDRFISDSLIWIEAWARRGRGFDAPWSSAGYVFSNRPAKSPLFYKHLDGPWYLYSRPARGGR